MLTWFTTLTVIIALWAILRHRVVTIPRPRSVVLLVLGDIGRSPRIMYHAQSFAQHDFETHIVGYRGSREISSLLNLPGVHLVYILPPPPFVAKLPRHLFLFLAPVKVVFQLATILVALLYRINHPPEFILVQNPPSIPTLALVWLAAKIRGSKVIIDWHNLGYSILAIRLGNNHVLVRLAKWFEKTFGRSAYAHLFVTRAMADYLSKEWNLRGRGTVFYDRPPAHFRSSSPSEVHDLFCRIGPYLTPTLSTFLPSHDLPSSTPFTTLTHLPNLASEASPARSPPILISPSSTLPTLRSDRPALIVSSTSWTEDEDFNVLINALSLYEQEARLRAKQGEDRLPKALVLVTGKGPLRDHYMRQMRELEVTRSWEWTRCRSLWLEPEDYPRLLGSADIGVSLHTSSSALDLPMKIVDMFGCGLPVLALDFKCLDELVLDEKNGLVFHTATELASHLIGILKSFPTSPRLSTLRGFLRDSAWDWCSWDENWNHVVEPIVCHHTAAESATLKVSDRTPVN